MPVDNKKDGMNNSTLLLAFGQFAEWSQFPIIWLCHVSAAGIQIMSQCCEHAHLFEQATDGVYCTPIVNMPLDFSSDQGLFSKILPVVTVLSHERPS